MQKDFLNMMNEIEKESPLKTRIYVKIFSVYYKIKFYITIDLKDKIEQKLL